MKKLKLFSVLVLILVSSYSFAQWTYVGAVSGAGSHPSISVVDQNTIFVAGGPDGTPMIFKSTNGGTSYTTLGTTGISLELYCVWAKDADNIYVGNGGASGGKGGNAKAFYTSNGGTNWITLDSTGGTGGFINGIVFSRENSNYGFIESDPPTATTYWLKYTTNGGTSWTLQSPPSLGASVTSAQNTLFMIDNLFYGYGSSGGSSGKIIYTTNGGTSWNSSVLTGAQFTSTPFVTALAFHSNKLNGIGAGSNTSNSISRTTDGGATWVAQSIPATGITGGYVSAKWVPNSRTVYIIVSSTTATQSFKSTDNGVTWTQITWPANNFGVAHMDSYFDNVTGHVYLYASCESGKILKLNDEVVGVNQNVTTVPTDYVLNQNYPNPFNPTTNINYSIPKSSFVTLKIYDILGNEVMTVVNEQQTINNYTYKVDFSKLSSGMYYYKLNAGDFSVTKKLMLVK
jgi:hypothetical protein